MLNGQGTKDRSVLYISAAIAIIFIALSVFMPNQMADATNGTMGFLTDKFGWFYLLAVFVFTVFVFGLAISPYGKVKLGQDDEKPEFSNGKWFAMLFSGGMGIGLVFWAVAEPMIHYAAPPTGTAGTHEAQLLAMRIAFNDFGLHPWLIYMVCGLALGYFQFRKGLPCLISSAFYPILGERIHGPIGKAIDILAVFATLFGISTSLGLGAGQIAAGIQYIWGVQATPMMTAIVIAVMTVIFTMATVSGLHKAMQFVANTKMALSVGFMVFIFLFGGSVYILDTFTHTLGDYTQNFIGQSLWIGNKEWVEAWPIFYRAWYIAWAAFVGEYIARISRGRTIREVAIAASFLPAGFCLIWLAIYGGAAFNLNERAGGAIQAAVSSDYSTALFAMLQQMPLYVITAPLALILIVASFAGAANGATFVLGMLTSGGDHNPSKKLCAFWGIVQGGVTIMLILVGGIAAIKTLQTASIVAAFPFTIIMLFMCYTTFKALREDHPAGSPTGQVAALKEDVKLEKTTETA